MRPKAGSDGIVRYKLWLNWHTAPVDHERLERLTDAVMRRSLASDKQVSFALGLLQSRGFSINQTTQRFEDFGLPVEPGNSVECWLANLSKREISVVIDDLKNKPPEFNFDD